MSTLPMSSGGHPRALFNARRWWWGALLSIVAAFPAAAASPPLASLLCAIFYAALSAGVFRATRGAPRRSAGGKARAALLLPPAVTAAAVALSGTSELSVAAMSALGSVAVIACAPTALALARHAEGLTRLDSQPRVHARGLRFALLLFGGVLLKGMIFMQSSVSPHEHVGIWLLSWLSSSVGAAVFGALVLGNLRHFDTWAAGWRGYAGLLGHRQAWGPGAQLGRGLLGPRLSQLSSQGPPPEVPLTIEGRDVELSLEPSLAPPAARFRIPLEALDGADWLLRIRQPEDPPGQLTGDPILDRLLYMDGAPAEQLRALIEGQHEALLAVLHGYPGSEIGRGALTLQAPFGALQDDAPLDAALALARALEVRLCERA